MTNPVSIRPSEFVEGGAVPVDRNLTWRECRFNLFDYTRKDGTVVATTVAARINYVDDDGQEFEQQYSVTDKERFLPSADGKSLIAVGSAASLSKSSNFYVLMNALINAGFPENKLTGDVSVLDGLYTYNIGIPEPKRAGLAREVVAGETARERILSVPSQILRLPGEKGKGGAKKAAPAKASASESDAEEINAKALKFVGELVDEADDGTISRQNVAVRLFKDMAKDPDKDAVARALFSPEFSATLLVSGFSLDGEDISRA